MNLSSNIYKCTSIYKMCSSLATLALSIISCQLGFVCYRNMRLSSLWKCMCNTTLKPLGGFKVVVAADWCTFDMIWVSIYHYTHKHTTEKLTVNFFLFHKLTVHSF